jgi:hypothetical protein
MGESEWKHAGWVSGLGKWAWIILLLLGIGRILFELAVAIPAIATWEAGRAAYALLFPGVVYTVPHPITTLIWPLIGGIITIFVALIIIRPKFSKPCGEKDWETLYGWTLKLGANIPWMFIWGIIFMIFGWFYITGIFVLIPAIMLIWFGPRKYEW